MIDNYKLGKVLRGLREDTYTNGRRLSIEALSNKSGLGSTTISTIEHGKASPTVFTLGILCWSLGVKMSTVIAQCEGKKGQKE